MRARLALTMSALILVIAAAIWFYLPRKLEEEATALITHKAETLAQLTAFTIHPAVYFKDRAALEEALSGTRQDKDVAYVIVTDPEGNRLAAFHRVGTTPHPQPLSPRSGERVAEGRVRGGVYETITPIRDGQRELARLQIGVSLERLHREIAEMRLVIGIVSAIILAAGLLAVILLSNVITRPLREVAAGAQRIAAGDLAYRVPAGRDDELGQLAVSFNDMAAKVAERDSALRRVSKRLLSIQEQERVRIAREVHDELGQALTAMKIDLQQLSKRDASIAEPLSGIARSIDEVVHIVRRIAADLRPTILDDLGVTAALEQQLRRLRETTGLETTLTVEEEPQLDMLTSVTLYRIAQEALTNVVRHANATAVEIELSVRDDSAILEIRDNGRGMPADATNSAQSLGLLGMRERAELLGGSVSFDSRSGPGTLVTVTLPLTLSAARDDHASPLR